MSLRFGVSQSGKFIKSIVLNVKKATLEFEKDIMEVGKEAHRFMIDFIASKTTTSVINLRNSTPLVQAIDFVNLSDVYGVGWGVGTIAKLEEDSYHFELIGKGGKHPNAGGFVPGQFEGDGVFVYAPYSGTGIVISTNAVIEPMNYVANTQQFVESRIKQIANKYERKVRVQ